MRSLTKMQVAILDQRRVAAVATNGRDRMPHLTAVWFLFDGESFYLAIPSSSAKARNLRRDQNMTLMIEVRESGKELGVSASGVAQLLEGEEGHKFAALVHEKYLTQEALSDPDVGPKFAAFDDVAIRLTPTRWITWDMGALDQQAFGGKLAARSYLKPLEP